MCDMCDGKSDEQLRRDLLARIAEHDFTMVAVPAEEGHGGGWVAPGFVYSVGLWSFHRVPELIVVGAPTRHAVETINRYAAQVKAGKRFRPGGPFRELLPGPGVMLELVTPSLYHEWFARSFEFYPTGDFPAYQALWPDRDGNWPWQQRWDAHNVPQPVLTESGRPESWPVQVVR
ncbi:DUF4262 domain-containing protein [Actinophytocola sp.]|uniref:DUF4262 domain-containing protein n=1 Tax=Actinophytocola sp. TaxID=1872138 RepID=UPI002D7F6A54|nr:DUF4262 domain-containing protein [Actinophytocola sp.]HET9143301.1 DUF4262 domain-containing protein [Actinophytocola sp.]